MLILIGLVAFIKFYINAFEILYNKNLICQMFGCKYYPNYYEPKKFENHDLICLRCGKKYGKLRSKEVK